MGERYNFPSFFLLVLVYCVPLVEEKILVIFGPVTTSTNVFLTEVTFLKLAFFYNEQAKSRCYHRIGCTITTWQ